jgi:hypothetical protein
MIIGGIEFPIALTAQHTVTNSPRSADFTAATCLTPFFAITWLGSIVVVIPVSSTFQISAALNLYFSRTKANFSKKLETFNLLKAAARAKLVASGFRMERVLLFFIKVANQSFPAFPY